MTEKAEISEKLNKKINFFDPHKDSIKLLHSEIISLNRKDLKDLSIINGKSHNFKKLDTNRDWSLNLYNLDIEGSCPRKFSFFTNKVDFTNKNNDIEKSSPKNYYPNINKKSFILSNEDIEFSNPQCNKKVSSRHTNPLCPRYPSPPMEVCPLPPPKFIRDSIDIKDIKGSAPNKLGFNKKLFKFPIKKEEIKDSKPKKPYIRKIKYEYMNYHDVTNKKIKYRNTNPLRPQYNWSYMENRKLLGSIDGNAPLIYNKYLYNNNFNLNTKDIKGAYTGSTKLINKYIGNTFYLKTKDISGAQADTLIRGIITKRHLNPITPNYQYLGHSEIQNIDNNPYFIGFKSTENFNNKKIELNKDNVLDNKIKIIEDEKDQKAIEDYKNLNNKNIKSKNININLRRNSTLNSFDYSKYKNSFFNANTKLFDFNNKLPLNKRNLKEQKNTFSTFTKNDDTNTILSNKIKNNELTTKNNNYNTLDAN